MKNHIQIDGFDRVFFSIIKPCPFCGSGFVDSSNDKINYNGEDKWIIYCTSCLSELNNYYKTFNEALKVWNNQSRAMWLNLAKAGGSKPL